LKELQPVDKVRKFNLAMAALIYFIPFSFVGKGNREDLFWQIAAAFAAEGHYLNFEKPICLF